MKPVTRNKIANQPKKAKPFWTYRRIAARFKVTPPHIHACMKGQRESVALMQALAAFIGPERFRELAAPKVAEKYLKNAA